jgi:large subunit ribosomal protein L5
MVKIPASAKNAAKLSERRVIVSRLLDKYKAEVVPALIAKFNYKNIMQVPKLEKIVINIACGDAVGNSKALDAAVTDLTTISGQKPLITRAKKSLAAWKLRKGMAIGCKVTLRGERMFNFLDKFMNIALPRVRDFRGVSRNSFDGRGNYAIGIKEQLIFPEIEYDKIDKIRGMDIIFVTSANSDEEAREFLSLIGMPFANA